MNSERISPFWVNGYQPFSAMYGGNELSLCTLESIGINRHTQFKELNEMQEDFLSKYFM